MGEEARRSKLEGERMAEQMIRDQQRAQECRKEIQEILQKYQCQIQPKFTISNQGVKGEVEVVPINVVVLEPPFGKG